VEGNSANADDYKDRFSRRPGDVAKEEYVNRFRTRPDNRGDRRGVVDRRPGDRYRRYNDYRHGYYDGYRYGYYHGYHIGHRYGYYYPHRHYYGPYPVFGFHFGGFGFYQNYWHFALVLGDPYVYNYYQYSWWDGRPTMLITWKQAVEAYPANYQFAPGTCVQLYIRTREDRDYAINVDPRYWDAQDPGELYAALWAELEQTGQLQIEDIDGAVLIFPAGMIQQIEARSCR
jgi:hypothetical protein